MPDYILSHKADDDLVGIYEYTINTWGIEQFVAYSTQISHALRRIVENPDCTGNQRREDLAQSCRTYRVEHHYIIYRYRNGRIEVARILHERMDFTNQKVDQSFPN